MRNNKGVIPPTWHNRRNLTETQATPHTLLLSGVHISSIAAMQPRYKQINIAHCCKDLTDLYIATLAVISLECSSRLRSDDENSTNGAWTDHNVTTSSTRLVPVDMHGGPIHSIDRRTHQRELGWAAHAYIRPACPFIYNSRSFVRSPRRILQ